MRQNTLKSSFLLVLAAFIWGVAFVAQSVGMDYVGPFAFLFTRSVLGGLVLIPCIFLMDHLTPDRWAGTDPMYRFFEKAWIWR